MVPSSSSSSALHQLSPKLACSKDYCNDSSHYLAKSLNFAVPAIFFHIPNAHQHLWLAQTSQCRLTAELCVGAAVPPAAALQSFKSNGSEGWKARYRTC